MNPAAGLKRMFSTKALVELLKALGKFLVVLGVALLVLSAYQDDLLSIMKQPLDLTIMHSVEIVGWCALWMACGLIIIAAVDVPFQLWDNKQKLMMTKQEVRTNTRTPRASLRSNRGFASCSARLRSGA